jgi:hypothetical protein
MKTAQCLRQETAGPSLVEPTRALPPLRDDEIAMAADTAAIYVMTSRVIPGRRLHDPLRVSTVWRQLRAGGPRVPVRLSALTWCGEWIMFAQLLTYRPAEIGFDSCCLACASTRRTTQRRMQATDAPLVDF